MKGHFLKNYVIHITPGLRNKGPSINPEIKVSRSKPVMASPPLQEMANIGPPDNAAIQSRNK